MDRIGPNRKRLEPFAGEAGTERFEHRAGRDRRQSQRVDADIAMLAAIEFQDIERHDPLDGGDQDLASPQCQRLVRRLEIGIADGVEYDIGALAVGEFADTRHNIRSRCVDDCNAGVGVTLIRFVLAHHADHARAIPSCDLHCGLPYLAVDPHYQHGLARSRDSGAPETLHRGDEGNADPGSLLPRQIFRLFHHGFGLDGEMRAVGTVAPDPEITRRAEHLATDPTRRTVQYEPGLVATGRAREYRVGHQP